MPGSGGPHLELRNIQSLSGLSSGRPRPQTQSVGCGGARGRNRSGGWLAVAGQFGSLIETRNGIAEVLAGRQAAATAENEALRRIGQELIEERHSREAVERALVLERSAKVAAERAAEAARSRLAEWQKTRGSDSQEQSSLPVPSKQMQVPKPRPARKATPGVGVRPVPAPAP